MFDVLVNKKKDRYFVSIPELVLSTSDKNLQKAFEEIEIKRDNAISNMIAADLEKLIPSPVKNNNNSNRQIVSKSFKQELLLFFCKFILIISISVGGLFLTYKSAGRLMEAYIYKIINIEEWSDDRVKKYSERTRNMFIKISPILKEFNILLDNN